MDSVKPRCVCVCVCVCVWLRLISGSDLCDFTLWRLRLRVIRRVTHDWAERVKTVSRLLPDTVSRRSWGNLEGGTRTWWWRLARSRKPRTSWWLCADADWPIKMQAMTATLSTRPRPAVMNRNNAFYCAVCIYFVWHNKERWWWFRMTELAVWPGVLSASPRTSDAEATIVFIISVHGACCRLDIQSTPIQCSSFISTPYSHRSIH